MKKQVIECEFEEYSNASELSDIDKALFLEAKRILPLEEMPALAKVVTKGSYYLLSQLTKGSGEE